MYFDSINDKVWDVVENEFVILNPTNLTNNDKINKQCNTMALNTIYNGIDSNVFEQIKDLEKASELWVRLEETYENTSTVKSTKLYMLKDKLSNFKMNHVPQHPIRFLLQQLHKSSQVSVSTHHNLHPIAPFVLSTLTAVRPTDRLGLSLAGDGEQLPPLPIARSLINP
jgi:hypothetical protein